MAKKKTVKPRPAATKRKATTKKAVKRSGTLAKVGRGIAIRKRVKLGEEDSAAIVAALEQIGDAGDRRLSGKLLLGVSVKEFLRQYLVQDGASSFQSSHPAFAACKFVFKVAAPPED